MMLTRASPSLVKAGKTVAWYIRKSSTLVFSEASIKPASVGGSPSSGSEPKVHSTKTREEFAKVWPRRYRLQEYHLNELKTNHTPVHMSGKYDKYLVPALGASCILMTVYSMYSVMTL